MSRFRDEAVVLRAWEWSETSQTVCVLCRGGGMVRGLAKGSRRERSSFAGGFEVATRGEVAGIVKANAELATLTEWDLLEVFWGARRSVRGHYGSMYVLDVTRLSLEAEDPHPLLFDALVESLRGMGVGDGEGVGVDGAVAWYLWVLLSEIGYRPMLGEGLEAGVVEGGGDGGGGGGGTVGFDPAGGSIVEDPGPVVDGGEGGVWRVRGSTAGVLGVLASWDAGGGGAVGALRGVYGGLGEGVVGDGRVERAGRLLAAYLRHVLGRDTATRELFFGG